MVGLFVNVSAEESGMMKDIEKFLSAFIVVSTDTLKKGNEVQLIEFCSFSTTKRATDQILNCF
jgi:nucleoid DNA-binding protein